MARSDSIDFLGLQQGMAIALIPKLQKSPECSKLHSFLKIRKNMEWLIRSSAKYMGIPFLFFFVFSFSGSNSSVEAYKNYTVGDSLGWYDNLKKPTVNYQKWAAGKTFSLGDFLIFNSDSNHSVVQTYNFTTYKRCDFGDAETDDTAEFSTADPSSTTPQPVTVAVPLLKEGMTYFFSGDYDGEQCKHGQHFKINVSHGEGLPESLKSPSNNMDQSPAPASPDDDDSSTPQPDTAVNSNFDHPKSEDDQADDDDGKVKKTSGSGGVRINNGVLIGLLGLLIFWIY